MSLFNSKKNIAVDAMLKDKDLFAVPVSFAHCKNVWEKDIYRINLNNNNTKFINFAVALLTDKDVPFLLDSDLEDYKAYVKNPTVETQERVDTLNYIKENRDELFLPINKPKRRNVALIAKYLQEHPLLMERTTECLNLDIDVNYAVRQALQNDDFDFSEGDNPIRLAWNDLDQKTKKLFKVQELD